MPKVVTENLDKPESLQAHRTITIYTVGSALTNSHTYKDKAIHVPQGRAACLHRKAKDLFDISSIYTENFNTCNIVVGIGNNELILIHADIFVNDYAVKNLLKRFHTIIWLYQEAEGNILKNLLLRDKVFEPRMQDIKFFEIPSKDKVKGLQVALASDYNSSSGIFVNLYPEHIPCKLKLLRHPDEHKFTNVHVLEQLIGHRARLETKKNRIKKTLIYSGYFWCEVYPFEFTLDDSHPLTKQELALFNSMDFYLTTFKKLEEFIKGNNMKLYDEVGNASYFALELESYLNDADPLTLFKHDLLDLVKQFETETTDASEQIYFTKLSKMLLLPKTNAKNINELTVLFWGKLSEPSSAFNLFLHDYEAFYQKYLNRIGTIDYVNTTNTLIERALLINREGAKEFNAMNYAAAFALFKEALAIFACYTCVEDERLTIAYTNTGRSAFLNGDYQLAYVYTKEAYLNRYHNLVPTPDEKLKALKMRLDECEEKLVKDDSALRASTLG